MERLETIADRELIRAYNRAITDIRSEMVRIYEIYQVEGELTRAQASRFLRQSQLERQIYETVRPTLLRNTDFLQRASSVAFEESFYRHSWAVTQQVGVDINFGLLSDEAVRAAVGLGGNPSVLAGYMSPAEITRHFDDLANAFANYTDDARKWISQDITQGVIRGESVPKIVRRLRESGVAKSYRQAQVIARTETLRSTGLGAQISYAQARDLGVNVREIWDATLDNRTRPEHAVLDGRERDTTEGWNTEVGIVPGPRRSGVASFDIQCRCTVRPQTEGYSPSVRRIRDEGLQPYQTYSEWARRKGITRNRYGQEFSFLNAS